MNRVFAAVPAMLISMTMIGCGVDQDAPLGREEAPPQASPALSESEIADMSRGMAVFNPRLMAAIDNMPDGFTVANNTEYIVLVRDDDDTARLVVAGAPELQSAENGVAEHQTEVLGRPQGTALSTGTMWSRFGDALYSSGRFNDGGTMMEETRVFIVRSEGVPLMIAYRYAAESGGADRLDQLRAVVGQL